MKTSLHPAEASDHELLPTRPSLLARLRNHEDSKAWHSGWEEFYHIYHPVIYGYALKHRLTETEADDVIQMAIIGLARSLPSFDPARCSFKTWLFRLCRNKIVDHVRRRERQSRVVVEGRRTEGDCEEMMAVADDQALPPDQELDLIWDLNLRRAALERVKNRVKPMTMRLYLHHVVDGNSVEETVDWFKDSQVTPEAVHLAKHRVQKMLNETIEHLQQGQMLA